MPPGRGGSREGENACKRPPNWLPMGQPLESGWGILGDFTANGATPRVLLGDLKNSQSSRGCPMDRRNPRKSPAKRPPGEEPSIFWAAGGSRPPMGQPPWDDPRRSSKDPLRSCTDPLRSSKDPLRSSKDSLRSCKDPLRSSKDPLEFLKF